MLWHRTCNFLSRLFPRSQCRCHHRSMNISFTAVKQKTTKRANSKLKWIGIEVKWSEAKQCGTAPKLMSKISLCIVVDWKRRQLYSLGSLCFFVISLKLCCIMVNPLKHLFTFLVFNNNAVSLFHSIRLFHHRRESRNAVSIYLITPVMIFIPFEFRQRNAWK